MGILTKLLLGGATSPMAGDGYGISPSQLKSPRQSGKSPSSESGGYFGSDKSTASSRRPSQIPSPNLSQQQLDDTAHDLTHRSQHLGTSHRHSRSSEDSRASKSPIVSLAHLTTSLGSVAYPLELPRHSMDSFRTASESSVDNELDPKTAATEEVPEIPWQNYEIPQELEVLIDDMPSEIRNIVQESNDDHRAMRASILQSQKFAAPDVVDNMEIPTQVDAVMIAESSEMGSRRSTPNTDGLTGNPSRATQSSTNLGSVDDQNSHLKPPLITLDQPVMMASQDGLMAGQQHEQALTQMERRFTNHKLRKKTSHRFFGLISSRKQRRANSPDLLVVESILVECTSCFDDIPKSKAVSLPCHHDYCLPCFVQLVTTSIQHEISFPPKCCLTDIPKKTIRDHLPPVTCAEFEEKCLEYAIPVGSRYYCVSSHCGKWIDTRYATRTNGVIKCQHCAVMLCTLCRGPQHPASQDCPQDFALDRTLEQAERAGWRRCHRCRTMVELNTGCRHITCKCSAEFCYTCGAQWQTCACTEADQARRDRQIRTRLAQYEADQRAEEEEVRAAVVAVEAAERQIREEREAEEARVQEEARELERLETNRVQHIEVYFECLRDLLERVRCQQNGAIQERLGKEWAEIDRLRHELRSPQSAAERDAYMKSEKAKISAGIENTIKALKRQHAAAMMETMTRHRKDQDNLFSHGMKSEDEDADIVQADKLQDLMRIQELERTTLTAQQMSEIHTWTRHGETALRACDSRRVAAKMGLEEVEHFQQREQATRSRTFAENKWATSVFEERIAMLAEDERKMIRNGSEVPIESSNDTLVKP